MTHEEYVEFLAKRIDEVELTDIAESTAYMRVGVTLMGMQKELNEAFCVVAETVGVTEEQVQEMELRSQIVEECVDIIEQLFDEHAEIVRREMIYKESLRGDMHGGKKKSSGENVGYSGENPRGYQTDF